MRIVAWNCGGGFHRKLRFVADLQPDVAIIAECCKPDRLDELGFGTSAWVGRLHYKGLAVFGFGEWSVAERPLDEHLEWVLPVDVSGPADLLLVAVCAANHRAKSHPERFRGMRQPAVIPEVIDIGGHKQRVVVAGDFNDNPVFDKTHRPGFAATSSRLEQVGLTSLYHHATGEAFGDEATPTLWWRDRAEDRPRFHIDYAWVSQPLLAGARLAVTDYATSVTQAGSDHAALIVDLDL